MAATCDLIISATAAAAPLLRSRDIRPGTHITAVGADAPGKQELDPAIMAEADLVVVDSISQCRDHGEVAHAITAGWLGSEDLIELGRLIASGECGRADHRDVTVADLTGIAVQD